MSPSAALIDEAALERYLDGVFGGHASVNVQRHRAGHSNETFWVTRGPRRLVLRRPPAGAFLPTAHDVGREFRVLSALAATPVRAPRAVLMCDDAGVIGAPFYLAERMEGIVVRDRLPEAFSPAERATMGEAMVDGLVELHSVDHLACGLENFGRPGGYLERQLRRWRGQLELTLPFTRPLPELERVGRWLGDHLPESQRTVIVHGDFKLDNVMFSRPPRTKLVAILDWEMSTLGDPLADLGWLTSFWLQEGEATGVFSSLSSVTTQPGFALRDHLVERYASATHLDVSSLDWYRVLALWKLAILLEGSYARHLAGATDDPFFASMKEGVPQLAARGLELAGALRS